MKHLSTILFSASLTLMLGICFYASMLTYGTETDRHRDLSDFSKAWYDADSRETITIDGSKYPSNADAITITKVLPQPLPDDAVIYMRSNHNEISSFINGRELFCEGVCRDRTFGITYTGIWVIIPLVNDDAGHTITLKIHKTDGNQGQMPTELLLINRNDLTNELARQSTFPIAIAFFMIALSIGLFIANFLLNRHEANRQNYSIVWLAIFILMSGIWMFTDDNIPCLFESYNDAWYFLSYNCFMLLPVPFARFVGECIPKSRKVMLWFSGGFVLSFLLSVITAVFFSQPLSLMLPMTHVLIIIGLIVILFYSWKDKDAKGKRYIPELFWGLCLFALSIVGAMVSFYFGAIRTYAMLFRVAALAFVGVLSLRTVRQTLLEVERARHFEQLTQTIPSGISRLNCLKDFSIIYGNDAYYHMFGYEPEEAEAVGFTQVDFMLLPEDRERIRQEITDKVTNNIAHFEIEARARHKSGEMIYMLTTNNYLQEKGEIVSVLTNITLRKNIEERLRIQELEFRIAAEQSDKYIMRYEIKKRQLHAHRKAVRRFGVPEVCENAEQTLIDLNFIGQSSIQNHKELFAKIHRGDKSGFTVLELYARDLSVYRWYHIDFTTVYDQENHPDQAVISFYDVTKQRENELAFQRLRQETSMVPQEQISTFACNLTRNEIDESTGSLINSLACEQSFDAYTEAYSQLTHPDDKEALCRLMNRENLIKQFGNGVFSHELEFRMRMSEKYRWLLLSVQVVKYADNDNLKAFVAIRDIDSRKNSELDLIQRSEFDGLTGIMNRASYVDTVNRLIVRQPNNRHVFAMMDVDHFKDVNDTLGHDKGDQVLRQIAVDLQKTLREGDPIGRLGGDEFSFCLVNLSNEDTIQALLERVRSMLNHDIGGGLHQSVSIGAAAFDGSAGDFVEVYKRADSALYQAKKNGRNQFALYSSCVE